MALFVTAAVAAGRRFGVRGLWTVWIAGIVVGSSFPFLIYGVLTADLNLTEVVSHGAYLTIPMTISAWVIARTLRRPRPVGVAVQLAVGVLAFVLTFLVITVVAFTVISEVLNAVFPPSS